MPRPSRRNGYGGVLPEGRLRHLVEAASGRGDVAAEWRRYLAALGGEAADEGERRLYPLVARWPAAAQLSAAEKKPLRAQGRAAAVRHEILFTAAAQIADLLSAAGVTAIFQKGIALQARVYREQAVRASSDIDIFVKPPELATCLAAIDKAGWLRTERRPRTRDPETIGSTQTRLTFRTPDGVEVDVHWSPRQVFEFDAEASRRFVADAWHCDYLGRTWLIPSDTWLLFETIEHGMAWNRVTPIRWLTDALGIVGLDDARIDWSQLCDLVERSKTRLQFATALTVLTSYTGHIPPEVLLRLSHHASSFRERIYGRCLLRPTAPPWQGMLLSASHLLLRGQGNALQRALHWPSYYRASALKCLSWSDVAARAAEKISGRP